MDSPPSPPQQPEPKKLKMSTTTTNSDDEEIEPKLTSTERKPRYKRRKIAIFFAYCGVGYQGMQKNPGAKTIEADLEEALYLSGAIPEPDRGNSRRFDWSRSARTDKGVSAVGQVVSGRFYIDPPGLVDRLNSNLPSQIRIFGFKRVTASFNAKKFCDRRRYVYLIPVFALDPSSHRDGESVLASLGSENELVRCSECSERGHKVADVMGRRDNESKTVENGGNDTDASHSKASDESRVSSESGIATVSQSETTNEPRVSSLDGIAVPDGLAEGCVVLSSDNRTTYPHSELAEDVGISSSNGTAVSQSESIEEPNPSSVENENNLVRCSNGEETSAKGSRFCYGNKEKERFNRILKHYEGTHNFHNFTTRTKAEDPSARRFIVSFNANKVVTVEGMDFVKCEVVGQSFMLHQIRKMIGLAVAVMRNCAPESLIDTAFGKDININMPTAPEVGLYLDECLFTSYNHKWKDSHEELSMETYKEEAEEFKMEHIYSHIVSTEQKEGVVALWLHSLNHRNYPDFCIDGDNVTTATGERAQVDNMMQ
ncbi:PREDICTED: tRNA pseudouridine synthase A, mitochondrial-like [Nelumbo nucifera]|uniref:tRNA pseudouridine synthase A, mitochondrial-like n=1 Tax=Nelumbo nucifera TaxID=4432 RepID=A0A1U8AIE6_NELNU|nr:PREDICTED: tRNA pseudouridine synthase A, mitochondrial-like [Nelumbo nucifera]XP_010266942.1 PREDICTED: tRNA pseudouridine synthase A, mitochondrial-like [Nelumbo nucifera]